ncbi:AraC-like DNA-binding protein [Loktanella ponticola]|uniref:AraC-like DNA-binding protein n=1 Tax=Yoonia ponticola TaxID=1524255 RepID=A0A7W9BND7_9RHOB|nr:AraC family transcriptional regulator [Yoonia ponticola]MBB5723681.1 AraC-like DNA-binding protein [Yoonia ponticola]
MTNLTTNAPKFEWIDLDPGSSFRWHVHDFPCEVAHWNHHPECEIHRIRNTSGVATVGDHLSQYQPGYLVLVGPNLPHNWVPNLRRGEIAADDHVVLQFQAERFAEAADVLPEFAAISSLIERSKRGVVFHGEAERCGGEILEKIGQQSGLIRLSLMLELLQVLAETAEYTILSSHDYVPNLDPRVQDALATVMQYVYDNLTDNVRLSAAARLVDMTEPTFSRFFKRNMKSTFVEYVRKLRVAKACELLSDTSLQITDICYESGYQNLSNFNRRFLAEKGVPPTKYRQLLLHARGDEAINQQATVNN